LIPRLSYRDNIEAELIDRFNTEQFYCENPIERCYALREEKKGVTLWSRESYEEGTLYSDRIIYKYRVSGLTKEMVTWAYECGNFYEAWN